MTWICKPFHELSPSELYDILQLRSEVFVVEQQCIFPDMDNKDQHCLHFYCLQDGQTAAYARLVPAGISFPEPSIGRVVSSPKVRGTGLGRELMQRSIQEVYHYWGNTPIRIGAQLYLENFYTLLGFVRCGDIYLEDNIQHIQMLLPAPH